MKERAVLLVAISLVLVIGMAASDVRPAHGAVIWTVSLDANSSNPIDALVEPSATNVKSFRVGAVINGTSANPLNGVFGWQFEIDYNASAFIAQGDPNPAATPGNLLGLYPDSAAPTVSFGAQTTAGTVNWAGLASPDVNCGFAFSRNTASGSIGLITVFFTLLQKTGCPASVSISANTLLANVAFELLNKPSTTQSFTISNVLFVGLDQKLNPIPIPGVTSGASASETVTNQPPTASFTVSPLLKGSSACTPITGLGCSAFAFRFAGSASSDPDDTISNPAGYFWDFGDKAQDSVNVGAACGILNCTQGAIAIHDYGGPAQFIATLRVQDSQGATGAARDSLGNPITDSQPSHTSLTVVAVVGFSITANPTSLSIGPNSMGAIGSSTITMTATPQTTGMVSFSAVSNPSGPNAPAFSFSPTQVMLQQGGTNSSVLTVSLLSNTPHVDYNVTVSAKLGQIVNNVTIILIPTTLTVQPGLIKGVQPGSTFTVSVVTSAANLFSWQFQLNYNSTLLSVSNPSVSFGSFWVTASTNHQALLITRVNQTAGTILLAATLFSRLNTFTGNGTLATITFTVRAVGITSLALSKDFLINAVGLGQNLSFSQKNGVFCNASCLDHDGAVAKFTITPSTVTIGTVITLSATVSNIGLNPETVQLTFFGGSINIYQVTFSIDPGNSTTVTYQYDTTNTIPGVLVITAQVALLGASDQNPANNSLTQQVTLTTPGQGQTSGLPLTYIAAAAAGAVIALGASIFLLKRRRVPAETGRSNRPQPSARVK